MSVEHDSRDASTRQADAIALAIALLLHVNRRDDARQLLAMAPDRLRISMRLTVAQCNAIGLKPFWDVEAAGRVTL